MLKRSPKSKIASISGAILVLIAVYITFDSLITLRSLAHNHGTRKGYYVLTHNISRGSMIQNSDFSVHEMFSRDAPNNAFEGNNTPESFYAKFDLVKGSIISSDMTSKKVASTIDEGNRIIFVPTKDSLEESFTNKTDLLSVSPDGFGPITLATDARILFDLTPNTNSDNSQNPNPGYFVEVTELEAGAIAQALSQSDVRFALVATDG